MENYVKTNWGESKAIKGDIAPTSYKDLTEAEDLKVLLWAAWMWTTTIQDITELQVTQCIDGADLFAKLLENRYT